MNTEQMKTDTSLFGGLGLALIGTTCCALPIVLVALGLGSAVVSMVAVMPSLTTLSQYKVVTFSLTAATLVYSYRRLHRIKVCSLADKSRLRWQKAVLWASTAILLLSLFASYALLPITLWWESLS
ncbi:MAG TPA: hypothetical protein EYN14_06160 [Alphaproteobacteria bacterium]|nr:hypothetical protein [Alphaproteobacteria bacterium]